MGEGLGAAAPETGGASQKTQLRVASRSVVLAVVAVGVTLAVLRVLASSGRVIAWVLMASSAAALVAPAAGWLSAKARLPRGLAVAAVMLSMVAAAAGVTYGLVGDVVAQTRNLQDAAPRLAKDVEDRHDSLGAAARESDLSARTKQFVTKVPERLRGGTPAEAIRSAATRGLAFLVVAVLTLFFLLHGPRLVDGAARQIHDDDRQERARRVGTAVASRAFGYARGTVLMATAAGVFAYGVARIAGNIPGPVPLALWAALWDAVPLLGPLIGALPIVAFAAVGHPVEGVVLALVFLAYAIFETVVVQARLERRTVRVGPFLTAVGGFAGLELYGIAGALLAVLAITVGLVVLDESAPA